MQEYSRLIGIDVGTKRVGIAQTDLLKTIASPVGTFSPDEAVIKISEIVKSNRVDKFVIGWPLTPKGEEGSSTQMVEDFILILNRSFPDIPVTKIDERFSSNRAREIMIEAGVPKKKRRNKKKVDQIAAAVILQSYLDSNN